MQTAYITHPACLAHDMGELFPEEAARIHAIHDQLISSGILDYLVPFEALPASREQLLCVHAAEYVDQVFAMSPSAGFVDLDGDTRMNPYSLQAALHAAGAVVLGVDLVMAGQVQNAFCNIRPPGHHAGRASASGFCLFNNVAIGAAHAMRHHGLQRVAIADFDVHHGNGTEEIFQDDAQVMLCSSFRHPYYPYSGADSGNAHIINVPLAAGCSGEEFRLAVSEHWLPALRDFQPELVLISAGFDAHLEDDMGGLALREADYHWVTQELKAVADRHAGGRIVSALEGGYALSALGRSAVAHIRGLADL